MNLIGKMVRKVFPSSTLTGTPVYPIELVSTDEDGTIEEPIQVTGYEDLELLRAGQMDYTAWLESSYVHEMSRRKAYYEMNQIQSDAAILNGMSGSYISPEDWNAAHSGPGWEDLRAMLPDASKETCVKPIPTNYVEVIINNRQVVYDTPPEKRELVVGDKLDEKATENLKLIYAGCMHEQVSKYLCRWVGLFATAFQVVSYDKYEDRLIKTNVEPQRVRVISPDGVNNLQHPECVVSVAQNLATLGEQSRDETFPQIWQVWWRNMWWYEAVEGSPYKDIDLTQPGFNTNPFKDNRGRSVKPVLVMHDNPTVTKIHEAGSDILILQNQVVDRMYAGNGHTMEYQSFAVPVITGADLEEVEAQPYSAAAPQVYRSELTKFQFAHPAAPIGESVGATTRVTRTFARLHSIDPELVDPETKVQSGVSRAQARTALTERRNQEFPKWEIYERESYWLTAIIWNTFNPDSQLPLCDRFLRPSDKPLQILVQFGELDLAIDPLSESSVVNMDLDNNLISQDEVIAARRRVPLTRATQILADIKAKNDKNRPQDTMLTSDTKSTPRIGQSGNRPTNLKERDQSKVGGNTTSATGNTSIKRAR